MVLTDADFSLLESSAGSFWKPQENEWYAVVISNWRIEQRQFKEEEGKKPFLVMDCLKINDIEYAGNPKVWTTRNIDLSKQLKPIFQAAQARNHAAVLVKLMRKGNVYFISEVPRTA